MILLRPNTPAPAHDHRPWVIALILVAGTLAAFWPVLNHGFVQFDDQIYVTENLIVQLGLTPEGMSWAFTTGYGGNWHPLTWLSHMLDCQRYGLNAGPHHLSSLLLHVFNGLLLFRLLSRMTGAVWRSAAVAALFAWHPLHVESVAWVAERKDVLSAFFWLLTTLGYVRYVEESKAQGPRTNVYYGLTLVSFALGLMAKPMLVTLPFVLLLVDYWPLGRGTIRVARATVSGKGNAAESAAIPWKRLVLEKLPLFALAAASCVVTFLVQRSSGAMSYGEELSLGTRLANAPVAYFQYLRKMVWPSDLAAFYPFPVSIGAISVISAVVLLAAISFVALKSKERRPWLLVGWLWFLGTLVPVLGLVQVGGQAMADRYTYLPLIGIFITVCWGIAELAAGKTDWRRNLGWASGAVALASCLTLTRVQTGYWKDSESLFRHAVAVTDRNAVAHLNLGEALDNAGKPEEARAAFMTALQLEPKSAQTLSAVGSHFSRHGDFSNAVNYFNLALRERPDFGAAHYNLGNALATQGKFAGAVEQYTQALKTMRGANVHINLGVMLDRLGRLPEAMAEFNAALRIDPISPDSHFLLAGGHFQLGRFEEAGGHYAEALRLRPGFTPARIKLGLVQLQLGEFDLAVTNFQQVLRSEPANVEAHYNLACAYFGLNNLPQAAQEFSQASRLNPNDPEPLAGLAGVFARAGRFDDAVAAYRDILRLRPNDSETHGRLAAVLAVKGDFDGAIKSYRDALQLKPDWPVALRDLAWILATNPKPELRNGAEAVRFAERACELSKDDPRLLSALDAAYAEVGRFDDAIKTATKIVQLPLPPAQKGFADQASKRLDSYRAGKPWRE